MLDPKVAGVSDEEWADATASCVDLRVARIIRETPDSCSVVFDVTPELAERFRYRAGQFLSFKIPHEGQVLTRSYSLSSSPETDSEHKVTVKRVDEGRVSNWINDAVKEGDVLPVVPPAGLFVLNDKKRPVTFFAGGSGITPCISLIKTALLTTQRRLRLIYANRDQMSVIFADELVELAQKNPDRLQVLHSLDDRDGFLDVKRVEHFAVDALEGDFYLCGPSVFMDLVERALAALHVPGEQIHIERFISPPDPKQAAADAAAVAGDSGEAAPEAITVVLDGSTPARRAGLEPPFSCEEGYCSCCMAKLVEGNVRMVTNDCLTPDLLEEGWVLTCQAVCTSKRVKVEYPD
jgi:3-ketosteroid 9alpha-monooxygenase subunit B